MDTDIQDQYEAGTRRLLELLAVERNEGGLRIGWKVGINGPAAQEKFRVPHSVFGYLSAWGVMQPDSTLILDPSANVCVEPEIDILMADDVLPGSELGICASAIGSIGASLEIVDWNQPAADLQDVLSHDLFHKGVAFSPRNRRGEPNIDDVNVNLAVGGETSAQASASQVLGPIPAIIQLIADQLGQFGETLRSGDHVISGSITAPIPLKEAEKMEVDFGPLGKLALSRRDTAEGVQLTLEDS